jgi:hypothetical protein
MQSGIGFGLASFSGFGCCNTRYRCVRSSEHIAVMRRRLWIRTQRPTFIKAPAYGDLLVLYVVHLKVVLTRTPGTGRARIDERIQDSAGGTKAHCKAARGLGLWGHQ